jgi:hypothetical protein
MTLHVNIQDAELFVSSERGQLTIEQEVWRE